MRLVPRGPYALGWWDYWAAHATTGPIFPYWWNPRNANPTAMTETEREAWVRTMVLLARHRARDRIGQEIREGRWWVPPGFTEADLDALIGKVYR